MTVEDLIHVTLTFRAGVGPVIGIQNLTEGDITVSVENSQVTAALYQGPITTN